MPPKSQILSLLLSFIFLVCHSQSELYLDENMQSLDSLSYEQKCKQIPFKCLKYETDSMTINKVLTKYTFGKITPVEATQLRKLLMLDSGKTIDENDVILVKYTDSIRNFRTIQKNSVRHTKMHDSINKASNNYHAKHKPYTKAVYSKNIQGYVKRSNKCIKKYERKRPVSVHYVYGDEQNVLKDYDRMTFIKDRGILKTSFFKIVQNYNLLILKPDGEYFLSGGHLIDDTLFELIRKKDWTKFKTDWESTLNVYKINGVGMFKEIGYYDHRKHCF